MHIVWEVTKFKLFQQVDVAELRQKLQTLESLKKELELLQRQKAASEQALNEKRRQSSGGVWGWIAGTPPNQQDDAWCNKFDNRKPVFIDNFFY